MPVITAKYSYSPDTGLILAKRYFIIEDGRIQAITDTPPTLPILELGPTVLMPGFVNAHCHLELTALGPVTPHEGFVDWIKKLVHAKQSLSPHEMRAGVKRGIDDLIQSGVTCIGDHISFNTEWEEITSSPLKGRLFGEVLGVIEDVARDVRHTLGMIQKSIKTENARFRMTIGPHSVHAVHPKVLKEVMREEEGPLSCHLAESLDEDLYFKEMTGEMALLMKERGIDPLHQGAESGLDYLNSLGLPIQKLLLVHGNYLGDSDLALIRHHSLSLVHCPGSHHFFKHPLPPLKKYLADGMNIALGTDSLASNASLDFLEELRLVQKQHSDLSAEDILSMATWGGARALQMEKEIGTLEPGKIADIIGFRVPPGADPLQAIFQATKADFVMIDGAPRAR